MHHFEADGNLGGYDFQKFLVGDHQKPAVLQAIHETQVTIGAHQSGTSQPEFWPCYIRRKKK